MDVRLFTVHSALLLASVYSARILEEFHLIRYKIYHPPKDSLRRRTVVLPTLHRVHTDCFTPPRQGGDTSFHDRLPCIVYVYDFIVRTHHLDLLSRLLAYYLVDLLLRNGWHSVLSASYKMVIFLQYNRRTLF